MRHGSKVLRTRFLTVALVLFLGVTIFSAVGVFDAHAETSGFSIKNQTAPTTITQGGGFTLKGTITSNATLKRVEIGVVNKSTGKWVSGIKYDKSGLSGKTFNIANADSTVKFGKLSPGSYYYRIWVHDANGTAKRLLNKAFTVKAKNAGTTATTNSQETANFTLKNVVYPVNVKTGSAFYLKGTITGKNKIKRVEVGVTNSAGTKWISGLYYNNTKVNAKTFDIKKADDSIWFTKLKAGTYYYRIWVHDVKGNKQRVLNQKFTVGNKATKSGIKNTASSTKTTSTGTTTATGTVNKTVGNFTLKNVNYPGTLTKGSAFYLKGTVTGKNPLKRIEVGVVKSGRWMTQYNCYYNNTKLSAKTFDITKADASILFTKLPAGTYYYRIWAHDTKGNVTKVLDQKFTVKAASSGGTQDTSSGGTMTDEEFETYMTKQGFPTSYKPYLRTLHKAHPTWKFIAQKTGLDWTYVLNKQNGTGVSLINPEAPDALKNQGSAYYNKKTGKYTNFDGRWHQASKACIAYYLDPRNFLNENDIYMFMDHHYYAATGGTDTIKKLVNRNNCFLNKSSTISSIQKAAAAADVNPNVLVSMIISEVGWQGSSITSGTVKGYEGYYNFFNIGAWKTDTMNAVQRGLWFAKGSGTGATSYNRPWNTVYKALVGGVTFYSQEYMTNNQYTYYTKKFNVMNGANAVATHQYGTCIYGPKSEGSIVKMAYSSNQKNLVFYIPVYNTMPAKASALPT